MFIKRKGRDNILNLDLFKQIDRDKRSIVLFNAEGIDNICVFIGDDEHETQKEFERLIKAVQNNDRLFVFYGDEIEA